MSRNATRLATALACTGLLLGAAGMAGAHTEGFKSKVTIKRTGPGTYKGKVSSDLEDCVKNRTVKVFTDTAKPFQVGKDKTNSKGRWKVIYLEPGSKYYAEVSEKVLGGGSHQHTCKFDRSKSTPPSRAGGGGAR